MKVESVTSVAVITPDVPASHRLYEELRSRGYELLHDAKVEPWGQTVARVLSPEGAVVGLSYAPTLHT